MKKNRKRFAAGFFILLFLAALLTFLLPDKTFSPNENRVLAKFPKLSVSEITNGRFQQGLADYLSDQIPLRDMWMRMHTGLSKFMGQKTVNGVYLGKDHYYFPKFTDESYTPSRMLSVFRLISSFTDQAQIPATVMLVPTAGTVLNDKLPNNAPYYNADTVYNAAAQLIHCDVLDLRDAFGEAKETQQLYYRNDHHWTTMGAYIAYQEYAASIGLSPREYSLEKVSDSFYGTAYSKVLDSSAVADNIYALTQLPKVQIRCDDGAVVDSPYQTDFLSKKDKYAYFFGGNWGKVTVDTENKNGEKLLVIKDSFANSFVPFLFEDFESITMLDLRYFRGNVQEVLEEQGITRILFLYETSNLLTDTGILQLQNGR